MLQQPGCMDESTCNFSADANRHDGSCDYQQLILSVKSLYLWLAMLSVDAGEIF